MKIKYLILLLSFFSTLDYTKQKSITHLPMLWEIIRFTGYLDNEKNWLYVAEQEFDTQLGPATPGFKNDSLFAFFLGYNFSNNLVLGGDYFFITCIDPCDKCITNEQRLRPTVLWSAHQTDTLHFYIETRLEIREALYAPGISWRVREKFGFEWYNIFSEKVVARLSNEFFISLNNPCWASDKTYDENWLFAGLLVKFNKKLHGEFGYLNQTLRSSDKTFMAHVFSISMIWHF